MTFFAFHAHFAAGAFNRLYLIGKVPKLTSCSIILILLRISSVILDVMGVRALITLMTNLSRELLLSKRAPYGFILVDVEIVIFFKQMYQFDIFNDLVLGMCKRTETFVVTLVNIVGVKLTEFSFVAVGMVELFEFIVGKLTILVVAFLFCTNKMIVLDVGRSAFVLIVMVVQTSFSFVVFLRLTIKYVCSCT